MTKIKFLLFTLLCTFITLQTTGCSSDGGSTDNGASTGTALTGVTLDKTALSLKEGETATLGVMLAPVGATGNISWTSSDATVASVSTTGVVTAIKSGTASVVAAVGVFNATCVVTVVKPVLAVDRSLTGSDYFVIQLDETSFASISAKVAKDLRPDDVNKNLYIWENTFKGGTPSGTNFYGLAQGWVSLAVAGSAGWSGGGWNVNTAFGTVDMTRMFAAPADYYLHIGFKTSQAGRPIAIILNDGNVDGKFAIGGDFNDNGTIFKSLATVTTDGKWNSIDIPVTKLNELGLFYNKPFTNKNILSILAGGTAGTTVDLDAVFYYKRAK